MKIKNKILILTVSTGQGHNTVAEVLKNNFEKNGYEVAIEEPLKKSSEKWNRIVTQGYEVLAVKFPHIYDLVYKLSNTKIIWFILSKIINVIVKDKIYDIIQKHQPSLIISSHAMLLEPVCSLKRSKKISIPLISIVTDYKAHQSYINKGVDAYITGSNAINEKLIRNGILQNRIYMYGIPVRDEFRTKSNNIKSHGIFTVLLEGGSMGVPKLKESLESIMKIEEGLKLIVVCGKNEELKNEIESMCKSYNGNKNIEIYGFSSEISRFMDESDVIVTKPGGITVAEAFYMDLPIIIPYYIPGHEKENKDVLVEEGAALYVKNNSLGSEIQSLIKDKSKLSYLKKNIYSINKNYSVQGIIDIAEELVNTYND